MYHIDQGLVNQIQVAQDLPAVKTAVLNVLDLLLVDIINSDVRRENGDRNLAEPAERLERRVQDLEAVTARLQNEIRQLTQDR